MTKCGGKALKIFVDFHGKLETWKNFFYHLMIYVTVKFYNKASPKKITLKFRVTKEESDNCEMDTRSQSKNKKWFSFRAGRITASKIRSVYHTKIENPSKSLIKDICYPSSKVFSSKPTKWGCDHDSTAKQHYVKFMMQHHDNFVLEESGFVINPEYPFMGATPDAIGCCDCCGPILVEIKCPYCKRDSTKIGDNITCLETKDGKLSLMKSHAYYYQVQCQLLVCDKECCDFVVWTCNDFTGQ
ncbi:uncharacterized protein LOC130010736 [Patella vulgata]|uniref:uncharacterized protein LOC130010736 n=1 Tax=Patella vulgata TaxID=6465 RepID=UPI0024A8EC97|nr:uncharacterized protein LOC130010736 [Patella vulgata]